MKEMKNLKRVAQEELEKLDANYANKSEFTAADAEMYKCLTVALEKQMRIEQIESEKQAAEEWGEEPGMSGRRGRGANGRYVSMYGGNSGAYADGYSRGYSEAMNQQSGHRMLYPEHYW